MRVMRCAVSLFLLACCSLAYADEKLESKASIYVASTARPAPQPLTLKRGRIC